jgi:flagellar L-ring protein precursor FlgH
MRRLVLLPLFLLMLAFASGVFSPASRADSIWDRNSPYAAYLFVDSRPRRVGDVVSVTITETTAVGNKDNRNLARNSNTGGTFNFKGNITGNSKTSNHSAQASMNTNVTSNRTFTGSSALNVTQAFTDRISMMVVDVMPNGNLVLEGYKKRLIQGEERVLKVSGIARPIDIRQDSTLDSRFLANFQMTYLGRGPETTFSRQGWLSRLINHVWPF